MATINIAFASGFAGIGATLFPALAPPVMVVNVPVTGTSAQSAAAPSGTLVARLCADVSCWVVAGANPTATSTTGVFLPQLAPTYVSVTGGQKIAVIA